MRMAKKYERMNKSSTVMGTIKWTMFNFNHIKSFIFVAIDTIFIENIMQIFGYKQSMKCCYLVALAATIVLVIGIILV